MLKYEHQGIKFLVDETCAADQMPAHHEENLIPSVLGLVPPGGVFVDVGAHVGAYSLRAASVARKVIAVEANPDTARRLQENLDLNGITNVHVYPFAAWSRLARMDLDLPNGQVRDGSARVRPAGGGTVPGVPLDWILRHEPRVDVIKLDVEGADVHALHGMAQTLATHRPVLFVEDHSVWGYYRAEDLRACLEDLGYCPRDGGSYGGASYILARHR